MKLNKKSIIIIISIILILSIVIGIIILKNINKPVEMADEVIETIEDNILAENDFIDESNIESADEIVNDEINVEDNMEETATTQTQEVKAQNNSNIDNNKQTQVSTQTKTTAVESKPQTTTTSTSTTQSTSIQSTPSQSSSQTTVVTPSAPKEEFKRNDQMINKIKSIIQNNETDLMKTYGYNIVVDSSIKTLTNQFTFYEDRVINSLRNKFGTIRIYADDCYQNGQFIMTECYIL